MKVLKTLTLDLAKWRCGGNTSEPTNRMGEGRTMLCNGEGYMCCLGQFAPQINPKVKDAILYTGDPYNIKINGVDIFVESLNFKNEMGSMYNTDLSIAAININDDEETTVQEKIEKLKTLFENEGYTIVVINNK